MLRWNHSRDVLKIVEAITIIECAFEAEAYNVLEKVVLEATTNLVYEVIGEKEQVASNVVETDMTNNNLNSIFKIILLP